MTIPVFDIKRQNSIIGGKISDAIKGVVGGGVYVLGKKVEEFEKEFAKYIGVKYAVGVASGTDAITLALLSLGVKPGDEVIMPANSYPSVFAVAAAGAIPKLVDIDPATNTLDPNKIEDIISKKAKAILAVHLYGQPANMPEIMTISRKYKIPVIEDCAQAAGAEVGSWKLDAGRVNWKKVGSIGEIGCFSFYPTKNLGCFGDGGMVTTNNPDIYEKLKLYRMYGEKERYNSILIGRNSRLDEIQAAILLVKLKYLDGWNRKRREIANQYLKIIGQKSKFQNPNSKQIPNSKIRNNNITIQLYNNEFKIRLPVEFDDARHVYHLFVIRVKERDKLKKYLAKKGIGTGIHYPTPIHLVPSFGYLGYKRGDFPESELVSSQILSLPMWPELSTKETESVASNILAFYDNIFDQI